MLSRVVGAGLGALALTGCPDLGYVYTDPDPTYPPPEVTNDSSPTTDEGATVAESTTPWPTFPETSNLTADLTSSSGPEATTTLTPTSGFSSEDTGGDADTDTMSAACGDGVVEGDEACDDGNQDGGDGCEADCTLTSVCGNGFVEPVEACDDGNNDDGDGCEADCTLTSVCGNGVVEDVEVCDDGNVVYMVRNRHYCSNLIFYVS